MGPDSLGAVDGHGDLASRASGFSWQREQQNRLLRTQMVLARYRHAVGTLHGRGIISSIELKTFVRHKGSS
jgi:hypothetical protein